MVHALVNPIGRNMAEFLTNRNPNLYFIHQYAMVNFNEYMYAKNRGKELPIPKYLKEEYFKIDTLPDNLRAMTHAFRLGPITDLHLRQTECIDIELARLLWKHLVSEKWTSVRGSEQDSYIIIGNRYSRRIAV